MGVPRCSSKFQGLLKYVIIPIKFIIILFIYIFSNSLPLQMQISNLETKVNKNVYVHIMYKIQDVILKGVIKSIIYGGRDVLRMVNVKQLEKIRREL